MKTRIPLLLLTTSCALSLMTGCAFLRSAEVPMPAVAHASPVPAPGALVVLLPGYGDGPDHYQEHGFVDLLQEAGPYEVVAADAHFGYYRDFTVIERLREDVIAPALADGSREVWLVGISMGGFGALSYAMRHPDEITGVIALAPYLGGDVPEEVSDAGGLRAWDPGDVDGIEDEEERHTRRLWAFLRSYGDGEGGKPRVILGWGDDDRLAPAIRLIADVLPTDQALVRDGGHKWTTWRPLFDTLVARFLTSEKTAAR